MIFQKVSGENGGMVTESKPTLLRVGPMARRLRVPVKWLRGEADANRVPHLRADTVLLFDPEAVEHVLWQRAREGVCGR